MKNNCCVCGKQLFDEKGKRFTNLCYQIGLMRKIIRKDGQYSDGSECCAHFYRKNVWDKIGIVIAWCEIPQCKDKE